jgi:integrase/recombinase XerD
MTDVIMINNQPVTKLSNVSTDTALISLWKKRRSATSQRVMGSDVAVFQKWLSGKALQCVTLEDLEEYKAILSEHYERATIARMLMSVKSLFTFGEKIGYLTFNVGKLVRAEKIKDTLNERILSEQEVFTIIAKEPNERNRMIISFLYYSGARVSEAARITWQDIRILEDQSAQITLFGKGDKTRIITLRPSVVSQLLAFKEKKDGPVFISRKHHAAMTSKALWDIVKKATLHAGIDKPISPHWFRHAHATHALDRGASLPMVSETLGHANIAITGRYTHVSKHKSSSDYLA